MNRQTSNPKKHGKSWVLPILLQNPQIQNKCRFVQLNIQRLFRYKSRKGSKLSHWLCSNAAKHSHSVILREMTHWCSFYFPISCWEKSTLSSLRGSYSTVGQLYTTFMPSPQVLMNKKKSRLITLSTDRIYYHRWSALMIGSFLCKYLLLAAGKKTPHTRKLCGCQNLLQFYSKQVKNSVLCVSSSQAPICAAGKRMKEFPPTSLPESSNAFSW